MMFGVGEGEALQSILMFGSDRDETEGRMSYVEAESGTVRSGE
jgi:hypothetical protein